MKGQNSAKRYNSSISIDTNNISELDVEDQLERFHEAFVTQYGFYGNRVLNANACTNNKNTSITN